MITCKLNPRVYDSLLVLLDAVRLYRVYRRLDTLPLYIYYELLIIPFTFKLENIHNYSLLIFLLTKLFATNGHKNFSTDALSMSKQSHN